jgi:polysaccharide biosynthesis protein PslH
MKVLIVTTIFPSPTSGNRSRNYYLLKMLARQHTVSLITLEEGTQIHMPRDVVPLENLTHQMEVIPHHHVPTHVKRLQQLVNVISGQSDILNEPATKAVQNAIDRLFVHDHYDVVLFEATLKSDYRFRERVKVIIDKHNIDFEILERLVLHETKWVRRWYNERERRLVKPAEIKQCREADAVVVTSERERILLKNLLPRSLIEVVPNGVDIEFFHGAAAQQEVEGRIIFTGAMDYYPNAEAVISFAQQCWPLIRGHAPGVTWHIVGKNPRPDVQKLAESPGITVTGSVADVRPSFAEAGVAIVPLQVGGGTRLKILEAMAMQKAVVSTSLGCEGLSAIPGKHLIVADQPETFAQAVIELLKNPEKRRALGAAGRTLVESGYSWQRSGDRLLHILELLK